MRCQPLTPPLEWYSRLSETGNPMDGCSYGTWYKSGGGRYDTTAEGEWVRDCDLAAVWHCYTRFMSVPTPNHAAHTVSHIHLCNIGDEYSNSADDRAFTVQAP